MSDLTKTKPLSPKDLGFDLIHQHRNEDIVSLHSYLHRASGLTVHFVPLTGRSTQYVGFLVPFGANSLFFENQDGQKISLPIGCAHYLEHCVFSRDEEGGLLASLSALGADANAYTTYTHTLYYLTCVGCLKEAFRYLYHAVLNPKIDEERVEAERGIIAAEFAMYQDDPDVYMYQSLMEKLFSVHPQRYDICGTKESIQAIRAEDLMKIVRAYYQPNQIEICFSGAFEEADILMLLAELLDETKERWKNQDFPQEINASEPEKVQEPGKIHHLQRQVGVPSFLLGIKDTSALPQRPLDAKDLLNRRLSALILSEIFLGEGSTFYQDLLDEGLLNDTFSAQYVCEKDCACWILGGESHQPQLVMKRLKAYLPSLASLDLTDEKLKQKIHLEKRALMGSFWKSLDSVSACGSTQLQARLMGLNLTENANLMTSLDVDPTVFSAFADHENDVFLTMSDDESC